jgi:hypothetical protein
VILQIPRKYMKLRLYLHSIHPIPTPNPSFVNIGLGISRMGRYG